jgi:hypothetical protein
VRASDGSGSPAPKTPAAKKGKVKATEYVAVSNMLLQESTLTRNFSPVLLAPSPRAKARLPSSARLLMVRMTTTKRVLLSSRSFRRLLSARKN